MSSAPPPARAELGWNNRSVALRVDDPPPGDEAEVDVGLMRFVVCADGKRGKLWVLSVTLAMSR